MLSRERPSIEGESARHDDPTSGDRETVTTATTPESPATSLEARTIPVGAELAEKPRISGPLAKLPMPADEERLPLLVSVVGFLLGGLLSPIGWYLSHNLLARFRAEGRTPTGYAYAANIIGILGTLQFISLAIFGFFFLVLPLVFYTDALL